MVKLSGRLSTLKVTHAREPGMLADGDGLYLQVTRANARSWISAAHVKENAVALSLTLTPQDLQTLDAAHPTPHH
jgi:hypothetical protein